MQIIKIANEKHNNMRIILIVCNRNKRCLQQQNKPLRLGPHMNRVILLLLHLWEIHLLEPFFFGWVISLVSPVQQSVLAVGFHAHRRVVDLVFLLSVFLFSWSFRTFVSLFFLVLVFPARWFLVLSLPSFVLWGRRAFARRRRRVATQLLHQRFFEGLPCFATRLSLFE